MRSSYLVAISVFLLVSFCPLLARDTTSNKASFLLEMGYSVGGEDLASVQFVGGGSQTISTGDGLGIHIGLDYKLTEHWGFQSTLGYHFDSATAANGDLSFEKMPLELIGTYWHNNHQIGLGLSYHLNPEFSFDFSGSAQFDIDFDNSLGYTIEYNYFWGHVYAGAKYTIIEYDVSQAGVFLDGNNIGLCVGFVF